MDDDRLPKRLLFARLEGGSSSFQCKRWVDWVKKDLRELGLADDFLTVSQERLRWSRATEASCCAHPPTGVASV